MRYCFSKNDLKNLLSLKIKQNLSKIIQEKPLNLSLREIVALDAKRFAGKTQTAEVFSSFYLSELYFGPKVKTEICFDMRSKFDAKLFKDGQLTYDDLERWIETRTAVDCYISYQSKELRFQIKRYPEPWKSMHTIDVLKFIEELSKKYGDMSDTILILIPQPEISYKYLDVDWEVLSKELTSLKINFNEVGFLVNVVDEGVSFYSAYKAKR